MEVHAHSHTARKKWTHYLWEFLMLFLAVFCGFLAENFREHRVEQHREREYIKTFLADLKSDTAQIGLGEPFFETTFHGLDTLMTALKAPDAIENPAIINNSFGYAKDDAQFISSNRTIQQLKNSGNMRLISKDSVSDALMNYDQIVQLTAMRYEVMNICRNEVLALLDEIIDENTTENSRVINREMLPIANPKKLLVTDRIKLDILFNKVKRLKGRQMDYATVLAVLKNYGVSLIELLQRKYHME